MAQFNQTKRFFTSLPNPNNKSQNDLYLSVLSGSLLALVGGSLYAERKQEYSQHEQNCRYLAYGLTVTSALGSSYHIIKYLRK